MTTQEKVLPIIFKKYNYPSAGIDGVEVAYINGVAYVRATDAARMCLVPGTGRLGAILADFFLKLSEKT